MRILRYVIIFLTIVFITGCKDSPTQKVEPSPISEGNVTPFKLNHAEGFELVSQENLKILKVKNPWPNADKTYNYALIPKADAAAFTFNESEFDGVILTPIETVVVTSTTHIPALELLGVEKRLIGFPGTDYISSKKTRALIDTEKIRELGKNEGINTEVLLDLKPEAVVAFGVEGTIKSLNTVQKSGVPIIYNGDWVEKTPLAKAEWIKFFGILFNKEKQADSIFNRIENDYKAAQKLAVQAKNQPTVLCGAMYKDVWYLPSGTSPEAQFLKDANVNYLWSETQGKGSLALSFEVVFEKAKNAELWLSPSYYNSLEAMEEGNQHYKEFEAFKNKEVYSFSNTTGETGGVLYYELGIARPDLVLKDMIKICHPDVLEDYETTFFKRLK